MLPDWAVRYLDGHTLRTKRLQFSLAHIPFHGCERQVHFIYHADSIPPDTLCCCIHDQ